MLSYTRNQGNTLEYNQRHETINSLQIVINRLYGNTKLRVLPLWKRERNYGVSQSMTTIINFNIQRR